MIDIPVNKKIKAIMGLGNPGPKYVFTPHNIGFLIVDQLCSQESGAWTEKQNMLQATVQINNQEILLIKPQTFMNSSGEVLSHIHKRGIKLENILVVHDEIDFEFGKITIKNGGSARGHNGLRSLIEHGGQDFFRLRVGVGRPDRPEDVGHFVTVKFTESEQAVHELIAKSVNLIEEIMVTGDAI